MEVIVYSLKIGTFGLVTGLALFVTWFVINELSKFNVVMNAIQKKQKEDTYYIQQNYKRIEERLQRIVNDLHRK